MTAVAKHKLPAHATSLDELFFEAREYGFVRVSTMSDGLYYCCIEFSTIGGITLEAKSGFKCESPHVALEEAIEKAKEVSKQFK